MPQVVEGKVKLMDNLSNYIIVDIGANLTNKKFSRDLDQVIQRATDSGEETFPSGCQMIRRSASINHASRWSSLIISNPGVSKIMVTGTSLHSTKEALRLTRLYPDVLYSTAGIKTLRFFNHCLSSSTSPFPFCHSLPNSARPNWLFPDFGQIADHRADYLLP